MEIVDRHFVEAEADVGSGAFFRRCGDVRGAEDIDRCDVDLLDFEFAGEQAVGRPFDAGVFCAQPDAFVVDEGDVGDGGGFERIAFQALDADGAEGAKFAAVDLRGDEGAPAVAGDPEAQRDGGGDKHERRDNEA